jgi:hypothetical protein
MLAEELLLLVLETGKLRSPEISIGLAGAVLTELELIGRVRVAERGESVRAGRLVLRPGPLPAHPGLATGLCGLSAQQGRKPEQVLDALGRGLYEYLASGLVAVGELRWERHRAFGLFPTQRLVTHNPTRTTLIRGRVWAALVGAEPDPRTAALVAVLSALKMVTAVYDAPDKSAVRRRAKKIAEGQWAATAVRKAIVAQKVRRRAIPIGFVGGDGGGGG